MVRKLMAALAVSGETETVCRRLFWLFSSIPVLSVWLSGRMIPPDWRRPPQANRIIITISRMPKPMVV